MKLFLFCSAMALLVALCRSIRSNSSLKLRNEVLSRQCDNSHKQIEILESIVNNLNKIFNLLGQRQEQHRQPTGDQLTQLELLSKIAEDSLQREVRIKADINRTLDRYAVGSEVKSAIHQILN